ncbi:unnamed protein product [Coffea canephora]|uniref:Uncharacterized protein n=1 Tax=Coffea canephora TaxID=49390 RepID=A0A068UL71_COFCA|nr:unnamed protein product [Coffea canephora]
MRACIGARICECELSDMLLLIPIQDKLCFTILSNHQETLHLIHLSCGSMEVLSLQVPVVLLLEPEH